MKIPLGHTTLSKVIIHNQDNYTIIIMNNISYNKAWMLRGIQLHVNIFPIPLIKNTIGTKSGKYSIKIRLCRNPTSVKPDMYEFKRRNTCVC